MDLIVTILDFIRRLFRMYLFREVSFVLLKKVFGGERPDEGNSFLIIVVSVIVYFYLNID